MPELGEVAHATSILRRFLVGKKLTAVSATEDTKVFSAPLTAESFETTFTNKTVSAAQRHGKYFWMRFADSQDTLLLHFGMTGWLKVKGVKTHFIVMESGGDKKARELAAKKGQTTIKKGDLKKEEPTLGSVEKNPDGSVSAFVAEPDPDMEWPPKYTKFIVTADDGTEVAFTDPRRLGKVRLIESETDEALMALEPLKRVGLDFSKPEGRWPFDTFKSQVSARKVPVKSLLLDQSLFAGVGNWVADEILYQARIHPEQYSNTLGEEQLDKLYNKLIDICTFVVDVEGNTEAFPSHWLMLHRWGKRRKGETQKTADGHDVAHVDVGGRTSCYVPALQRKSGGYSVDAAGETAAGAPDESEDEKPAKKAKTSRARPKK